MLVPYIGISDFTSFSQVQAMLEVWRQHRPTGSNHLLHVGVMMSRKTLLEIPCRWTNVFPANNKIAAIFGSDEVYNCLHYADYECSDSVQMARNIDSAIFYGGTGLNALQLDMIWPDPGMVAHGVHMSRKRVEMILQIGANALMAVGNNTTRVVEKLEDYEQVIHRVLLDKSIGNGREMNPDELMPFARAIRRRFPEMGIGVAGGLGPSTIELITSLAREFPDVSIDAQSRLRPSGSALDPIDLGMAGEYLEEALEILK